MVAVLLCASLCVSNFIGISLSFTKNTEIALGNYFSSSACGNHGKKNHPLGEAKSINKEKTQNGFLTKTTFASHLI